METQNESLNFALIKKYAAGKGSRSERRRMKADIEKNEDARIILEGLLYYKGKPLDEKDSTFEIAFTQFSRGSLDSILENVKPYTPMCPWQEEMRTIKQRNGHIKK